MDYDFRNKVGQSYDSQIPMYRQSGSGSYPRVGQPSHPPVRSGSYHHTAPPSSSSGLGIRVAIKPEYRITPPPNMSPHVGDISRSNFQFDFEYERKVIAELEKETQNWSRLGLDNLSYKPTESSSSSSLAAAAEPVMGKYTASGLNRETVSLAVAHYGDNPTKVQEFVNGYNILVEMGFPSKNVAEALLMVDNDKDKATAYLLNSSQ